MTTTRSKTPKLPDGSLVWFTITTLWRPFTVVLTNSKACRDIRGRFGVTDVDTGIIFVQEGLPYDALVFLVVHELLHAMLSTPGESDTLCALFSCSSTKVDKREELVVVHLTPRIVDAFVRSGLLTFPPLPVVEASVAE